jgi:hypothetical protein
MSDDQAPKIEIAHWEQSAAEQQEFLDGFLRRQGAISDRRRDGLPTAQQNFSAMAKNEIAPRLRQLGFKGSGQKFRFPSERHLLALDIQKSAWNDSLEVRFTVNLSAEVLDTALRVGEAESPARSFTHRERLGMLARGRDYWWTVPAEGLTLGIAEEVVREVRDFGVPWLRQQVDDDFTVPWLPGAARD